MFFFQQFSLWVTNLSPGLALVFSLDRHILTPPPIQNSKTDFLAEIQNVISQLDTFSRFGKSEI